MFDISPILNQPFGIVASVQNQSVKNGYDQDMRRYKELMEIMRKYREESDRAYEQKDYKKADSAQKFINKAYKEFLEVELRLENY